MEGGEVGMELPQSRTHRLIPEECMLRSDLKWNVAEVSLSTTSLDELWGFAVPQKGPTEVAADADTTVT